MQRSMVLVKTWVRDPVVLQKNLTTLGVARAPFAGALLTVAKILFATSLLNRPAIAE